MRKVDQSLLTNAASGHFSVPPDHKIATDIVPPRRDNRLRTGKRRSNVDRSAETRMRIIEATIECLHVDGYSASTMAAIADKAGATRGAIMHHFANMSELMVAVATHIAESQFRINYDYLMSIPSGRKRFLAIVDMGWNTALAPSTSAMLKILIEGKNHPEMSGRLPQIQLESEKRYRKLYLSVAKEAGIADEKAIGGMFQLHICTIRGLAMTSMAGADIERSKSGFELLRAFQRRLFDELATGRHPHVSESSNSQRRGVSPVTKADAVAQR
jgi:AcrR family transcriptional regulator